MKTSLSTRLAALSASAVITLVIVGSMALVGHPQPQTGTQLAGTGTLP